MDESAGVWYIPRNMEIQAKQEEKLGPSKRTVLLFFPTPMGCIPALGRLLFAVVVLTVVFSYSVFAQQVQADKIKNFKIPEYNEKTGALESIIYGDDALFNRQTRVADINALKIEIYKNNKVETVVTSPVCVYDQNRGTAKSADKIMIRQDKLQVTGVGYTWNRLDQVFRIEHEARVELRGMNKSMNKNEAPPHETP